MNQKTSSLNVFLLVCMSLLLMAGCAKKTIPPTTAPSTGVTSMETLEGTESMPGGEMTEAEDVLTSRIDDMASDAPGQGMFSKKIYFAYDRSDLTEEARSILKEIAEMMRSNPSRALDIAGHCDERGTIEYNLALGEKRARSAKKFLMNLGVGADRLSTISYGEERPVDTRSLEEAWSMNRRCEFNFLK